jgi:hypothetical protein
MEIGPTHFPPPTEITLGKDQSSLSLKVKGREWIRDIPLGSQLVESMAQLG